MAKYTSPYSGERIDRSVGMIPDTNPKEESILVISKAGKGSYKKVSEVGVTVVQATGDSETQVMSQDATTKELNKKLNLIEPTGVQTEFVVIGKDFGGNVQQISLRGVFTPQTQYETFLPVLRGLQGQIRGQTAPLARQNDLDLINRGELTKKLRDKASKTYIHKVNMLSSDGGVPPMEIQVYSKSITAFTQISDIPDGCYTMTNVDDGYFGLLAFYNGKVSRLWNSGETLNCQANITPSETSFVFDGDTVVEL